MGKHKHVVAGAIAIAAGLNGPPAGAQTQPSQPAQLDTGEAFYEGTTIDLQDGWQDASVCSVYSDGATHCFDDVAQADAHADQFYDSALDRAVAASPTLALAGCPQNGQQHWLHLGDAADGRILRFQSMSVTQNLGDWNFANKTDRYWNQLNCNATGYDAPNGGGDRFQFMVANSGNTRDLPDNWKNRFDSIRIHQPPAA